ncbi:serine/threonine/tyrosine-interacting protein B-like [Panonychus citri]|uniref:serine/threonine/tyrosine-interacting protein B-like n=1 Tax=Panonychus citri TaxID=50023 RepID=UPI0023073A92|nr:serine/threonine/tyrosine-interacting protein B-like [Panonychus citri]
MDSYDDISSTTMDNVYDNIVKSNNNINFQSSPDSSDTWEYTMRRDRQEIVPGIYLGPYSSATRSKINELHQDGITHIICVRDESESKFIKPNFPGQIQYMVLNISDNFFQAIIPFFSQVKDFINDCLNKHGKVLVHGNAGISRSASLVISYLMDVSELSYPHALALVQSKRYCVHPNPNFQRQLLEYEPILRAQNVMRNFPSKRGHELIEEAITG